MISYILIHCLSGCSRVCLLFRMSSILHSGHGSLLPAVRVPQPSLVTQVKNLERYLSVIFLPS